MAMTLEYSKQFLSGNLKGIRVRCSYPVPDQDHLIHDQLALNKLTKDNPGKDCVTGDLFWVYNIGGF
jgi:hypothetical protein